MFAPSVVTFRPSKAIIASASIGLIALFVMPGFEGAYRLSKWGASGFDLLILSGVFLFSIRKTTLSFVPKERILFLIALAFAASAIILPVSFTPFMTAHIAGTLRLLMGLSFAYLTALAFEGQPDLKRQGLKLILAVGGFCSIIVILQAAGIIHFLANTYFTTAEFRSPGTFGNPNWAAAFLLPLVPISLGLIGNSVESTEKYFLHILTLLIIIGTLVTLSKAGILALFSGIIIFIILDQRIYFKTRWLIVSAISLVTAVILIIAGVNGYFTTLPRVSWMRGRLFLWKGALALIANHPISGTGLGGFLPSYPQATSSLIRGDPTAFMPLRTIDFMHNDPLQIAVEGGLLTVSLYLVLILGAIYISYSRKDDISRGIGAAVAAIFIYGLADSPLQLPATFMLFWFLIGWVLSGDQDSVFTNGHKTISNRHRLHILLFIVVLLIISLLSLTQCIRFIAGNIFWSKGKFLLTEKKASGIKSLQIATTFLPEIGQVRSDYAKALGAAGLTTAALKEIDAALKVYFDFEALFLRLRLLKTINGSSVIEEWQRLTREFPALVTPHYELGLIYLKEGKVDSAVKEFLQVLKTNQDTGRARFYQEKVSQILQKIDHVPSP